MRRVGVWVVLAIVMTMGVSNVCGQCQSSINDLGVSCGRYITKHGGAAVRPSKRCCSVVRATDISCTCKYVTKEVEKSISMGKAVGMYTKCGVEVPPGLKCGSYTVPA